MIDSADTNMPPPPPPEHIPPPPTEKKKGHRAVIAACILVVILLIAVSSWLIWAQGEAQKITVSPGVPSVILGLTYVDIKVPITIRNDGGLGVMAQGGSLSFHVSGEHLASSYINGFSLSPHDSFDTEVNLHIEYINLDKKLVKIIQDPMYGRPIVATIYGNIDIRALIFSVNRTFSESYNVSCSIVKGTVTTDAWEFRDSSQRKVIYDGTRWWIFYFDHSNIVYRYSTDGKAWSDKASTDSGGLASAHFSIAIRDTTVALCWGADVPQNVPIYFKKGTISGGTISWDATVDTKGRGRYLECTAIAIDTNNNFYVAFNGQNNYFPTVVSSTDGISWYQVFQGDRSIGGQGPFAFILSPLSDGKVLFLFSYYDYSDRIDYAYFDGSSWSSQQHVYKGIASGKKYDVISACGNDTDTVHIARLDDSGHVKYCTYTFPDIWSEDTAIETEHTDKYPNIGMTDDIYVFYIYNNIIHMRRYSGVWEDETTPFGTSFASPAYVITEMKSPSYMIGVAWREGTANPYVINFGILSEAACHCTVTPV